MDVLSLVKPNMGFEEQILEYRRLSLEKDGRVYGVGGLADLSVPAWLDLLEKKSRPETCPEGLVPDSTFLCVREADGALAGMVNIRHTLNEFLLHYGGHVGYSVHPAQRGKGYGKEQLRLALLECRKLGISPALLTCEPWNAASRAVILSQGGRLEDVREKPDGKRFERYWIPTDR